MKCLICSTLIAGVLGLSGVFAMAQVPALERSAGHADRYSGESFPQPGMRARHMGGEMKHMMAKMPADMMIRCRLLMNMAISPNDPSAILALKDQLHLTAAQTTQLEGVQREAQDKATAVLNADQKKTLDAMPQSPQTMKDMHEQMMGQMQKLMGAKIGDQQMMCPMMQMMADQSGPTTQAETGTPTATVERDRAVQQ